jgi:hypothetical protein
VPAWLVAKLLESMPPVALVAGGAVYAIVYLVLCYAPGIAEPAAIRLPIMERIQRLPFVGRAFTRQATGEI